MAEPPLLKIWGGDKKSGGRFHDKFKLMKNNVFSIYLVIFNSGLLLLIEATWLTINAMYKNISIS